MIVEIDKNNTFVSLKSSCRYSPDARCSARAICLCAFPHNKVHFPIFNYTKMKTSTVAVLGGTGKSGKYIVQALTDKRFQSRLLLRSPENFPNDKPGIEIIKGDARQYTSICELIDGCDAVISTLGQPRGESSIFSEATKNVIRAIREAGIKRYIVVTGLNVNTPYDLKDEKVKYATDWMYKNYPTTTIDKQLEYDILSNSDIDWTLVRAPLIEQTEECRPMRVSLENCPGDTISATDLANFLVSQLSDQTYIRQAPFIANV
jgi:putative NADH-flavin reductase